MLISAEWQEIIKAIVLSLQSFLKKVNIIIMIRKKENAAYVNGVLKNELKDNHICSSHDNCESWGGW